jgi:hypothetical protein
MHISLGVTGNRHGVLLVYLDANPQVNTARKKYSFSSHTFLLTTNIINSLQACSLFAWAENKRLKVLLADLCERKTLLVG